MTTLETVQTQNNEEQAEQLRRSAITSAAIGTLALAATVLEVKTGGTGLDRSLAGAATGLSYASTGLKVWARHSLSGTLEPETAPIEVLPPQAEGRANKKFDHSESFLTYRRNRASQIKQMPKDQRRRAKRAMWKDYATANIVDTNFYDKQVSTIDESDRTPSVGGSDRRIKRIAARLRETGGRTAERGARAAALVGDIGFVAVSRTVGYAAALPPYLRDRLGRIKGSKTSGEDHIGKLGGRLRRARAEAAEQGRREGSVVDSNPEVESQAAIAKVASFNQRLNDPTYVPTPEEYSEMSAMAAQIRVAHDDAHGQQRVGYYAGGQQLQPVVARSFLDRATKSRWLMRDGQKNALSLDEFSRLKAGSGMSGTEVMRSFDQYRSKRVALDGALRDEVFTDYLAPPADVTGKALQSFIESHQGKRGGKSSQSLIPLSSEHVRLSGSRARQAIGRVRAAGIARAGRPLQRARASVSNRRSDSNEQ